VNPGNRRDRPDAEHFAAAPCSGADSTAKDLHDRARAAVSGDARGRTARDERRRSDAAAARHHSAADPARGACLTRGISARRAQGREPGTALLLPRMQPVGDLDSDELTLADGTAEPWRRRPPSPS